MRHGDIRSLPLTGNRPSDSLPRLKTGADIAQLVEQLTRNEQVVGSSPTVGSISLLVIGILGLALAPQVSQAAPGLTRVVIDAGHGGTNEGAPYPKKPGRFEKHYTLSLSQRVARHLKAAGVEVIMTRTRDKTLSLKRRINLANRKQADVFVSIHYNATDTPGPTGHETFFLSLDATDEAAKRLAAFENDEGESVAEAGGASPPDDSVGDILRDLTQNRSHADAQRLAALIQRNLTPQSPFKNRGVKQAPFVVLMGASMPAVVVEVGFINHRKEGPFITSKRGQKQLSKGIAQGILDFGRLVLAPRQTSSK